jgi:hypothetical protein
MTDPLVRSKLDRLFPPLRRDGWSLVRAIHRQVLRDLKPLPASPFCPNPALKVTGRAPADWESFEWSVLCRATPVWTDSAGFAVTTLRLCLEAGIPAGKMALAVVASEDALAAHERTSKPLEFDHVVCIYWNGHEWKVLADGAQKWHISREPLRLTECYTTLAIHRAVATAPAWTGLGDTAAKTGATPVKAVYEPNYEAAA